MNFDPLFEDLEARFIASELADVGNFSRESIERAIALDVVLLDGRRQTLMAPVLGLGFAAGLNPAEPIWSIVAGGAIKRMEFRFQNETNLPTLQFQEFDLVEHLELLKFPVQCSYRTVAADSALTLATLLAGSHGFLFLQLLQQDSIFALPIAQLSQIFIGPVHNSDGII